jgi:hypothetical protein
VILEYDLKINPHEWALWLTYVIPALGRLRQEDHEIKANLSYITSLRRT